MLRYNNQLGLNAFYCRQVEGTTGGAVGTGMGTFLGTRSGSTFAADGKESVCLVLL